MAKQMTAGPGPLVAKNGVTVREVVVEKGDVEVKDGSLKVPEQKSTGQRFYMGHRLEYTKDVFCNIVCLHCGIVGRTYLTPFEKPCEKEYQNEYDWC